MSAWRVAAAALTVLAGVVLLLSVMAKTRERTERAGTTAISGAVTVTTVAVVSVLTLTVLPGPVAWGIAAALAVSAGVLLLAS